MSLVEHERHHERSCADPQGPWGQGQAEWEEAWGGPRPGLHSSPSGAEEL